MSDNNDDFDHNKAFYDFYDAAVKSRDWDFFRLPPDIAFWRFCFYEAISDRLTGGRQEDKGTQLAKLFLLGCESASGKKIIQRIERVYINSVGDMQDD